MMPEYFEFYNPVKIMCGEAALENIPYELTRLGAHKIFVLISRTMLNDGILERIGGLGKALIETDIPKDSSFAVVKKLAQKALVAECDGVLAVGGGSVLDTAKVVRALISQRKTNPRELLGKRVGTEKQPNHRKNPFYHGTDNIGNRFGMYISSGGARRTDSHQA